MSPLSKCGSGPQANQPMDRVVRKKFSIYHRRFGLRPRVQPNLRQLLNLPPAGPGPGQRKTHARTQREESGDCPLVLRGFERRRETEPWPPATSARERRRETEPWPPPPAGVLPASRSFSSTRLASPSHTRLPRPRC